MFGKRDPSASGDPKAPPPAPAGGAAIATRPQRIEPVGYPTKVPVGEPHTAGVGTVGVQSERVDA